MSSVFLNKKNWLCSPLRNFPYSITLPSQNENRLVSVLVRELLQDSMCLAILAWINLSTGLAWWVVFRRRATNRDPELSAQFVAPFVFTDASTIRQLQESLGHE